MQNHNLTKAEIRHNANAATPALEGIQALLNVAVNSQEIEFYKYIINTFDFLTYANIQSKHLQKKSRPIKFLDFPRWIKKRYELAINLNLDQTPPMRILDIGCGPGHFGYVCRYFGHEVLGIDVPDVEIFNDLVEVIGTNRIAEPVRPMIPLSITNRYDYVTALSANFFRKLDNTLFTLKEWEFFFENLIGNHMHPTGKIYFTLNSLEQVKGLHYYDKDFIDFIEDLGGEVNKNNGIVTFTHVDI